MTNKKNFEVYNDFKTVTDENSVKLTRMRLTTTFTAFVQSFPIINEIYEAVDAGILGDELMPTPTYWHWGVLEPQKLSARLRGIYDEFGEIRWYGYKEC